MGEGRGGEGARIQGEREGTTETDVINGSAPKARSGVLQT